MTSNGRTHFEQLDVLAATPGGRGDAAQPGLTASHDPLVANSRRIDFAGVNAVALRNLPALLSRWLPDGRVEGREWSCRNPRRADRHAGSFKINLRTGRWADFASGDKGGDVVSLCAFLHNLSQVEAARRLAGMLGVAL